MENPKSELLELRKFRGVCSPCFSHNIGFNRIPLPLQITRHLSQGRLQGEISEDLLKYDLHNTYEVVDNSKLTFSIRDTPSDTSEPNKRVPSRGWQKHAP